MSPFPDPPIAAAAGAWLLIVASAGCAGTAPVQQQASSSIAAPLRLVVTVIDDRGAPVIGTFVRVTECCHSKRGPCGRVPLDGRGRTTVEVCPGADHLVHVTLTPDPRAYRVAPIREVEVRGDTEVTLTVTRHATALERLKASD